MPRRNFSLPVFLALGVALAGCATAPIGVAISASGTSIKSLADISGVVRLPESLLAAAIAVPSPVPSPKAFGLLALGAEQPLPDALVYLADPRDQLYRANGKMITATTSRDGEYRFGTNAPQKQPVIVSAVVSGNRRLVAYTVPDTTPRRLDLSVASTYVTELLRQEAERAGKSMLGYDLAKVEALVTQTRGLMDADALPVPPLEIAQVGAMNRRYALAVGQTQELGNAWASLLGRRVLALATVAGTGVSGDAGDGALALDADLFQPRQAVSDPRGNLFIADEGNHRIRRVDAKTGKITTVAGTGKGGYGGDAGLATLALLHNPRALALDGAGNLYIADRLNARIRRVDAVTGIITTLVGNPPPDGAGGYQPGFSGDGGPAVLARVYAPRSLVVDANGDLFFTDTAKDTDFHIVRKVDMTTLTIKTVVGQPFQPAAFDGENGPPDKARLNNPGQLAIDAQGRLLIADTGNHCVRRCDFAGGTIVTIFGVGGNSGEDPDGKAATRTRLSGPFGIAVSADGRLFVGQLGTSKIVTAGADGLVRTVAGGGPDLEGGDALQARLGQPGDLWIEPTGNVLVADVRGARIRRLVTRFGL